MTDIPTGLIEESEARITLTIKRFTGGGIACNFECHDPISLYETTLACGQLLANRLHSMAKFDHRPVTPRDVMALCYDLFYAMDKNYESVLTEQADIAAGEHPSCAPE